MDRGEGSRRAKVAEANVADAGAEVMGKCNGYNNLSPFYVFIPAAQPTILEDIFY